MGNHNSKESVVKSAVDQAKDKKERSLALKQLRKLKDIKAR